MPSREQLAEGDSDLLFLEEDDFDEALGHRLVDRPAGAQRGQFWLVGDHAISVAPSRRSETVSAIAVATQ